jgi:hypothetical protein
MRPSRGMGAMLPSKVPRAKRRGDDKPVKRFKAQGKQFVSQPKSIKNKVRPYREK